MLIVRRLKMCDLSVCLMNEATELKIYCRRKYEHKDLRAVLYRINPQNWILGARGMLESSLAGENAS